MFRNLSSYYNNGSFWEQEVCSSVLHKLFWDTMTNLIGKYLVILDVELNAHKEKKI